MAMIGLNLDFGSYGNKTIPVKPFYNPYQLPDVKLPDSKSSVRNGLAQQILHTKMVEMQWKNK